MAHIRKPNSHIAPKPLDGSGLFLYVNDSNQLCYRDADNDEIIVVRDENNTTLAADTISEVTAAAGVTVDGVLLKDSEVTVDVINEATAATGVTLDGALVKDGSFIGKQATATATSDGLTTGALTGTDQFVSVTSASANNIVAMPLDSTCPIGTVIRGWVGANGCEIRSIAADTSLTLNNVTMGTTNEAAIPATSHFRLEKMATNTWLLTATTELGAVITAIVPDAV
jgi:hypothetical protein